MIVREVIEHPELLDNFDYYNDYKDTKHYLEEEKKKMDLRGYLAKRRLKVLIKGFSEWAGKKIKA